MGPAETVPTTPEAKTEGAIARYDLSAEEIKQLSIEFFSTIENKPDGKFGCYKVPGVDKFANLARTVEGEVFSETFKHTPQEMAEEYGPYESSSYFYVVFDHQLTTPVGALRVTAPSEAGLKTLNDLPVTPLGITPEDFYKGYDVRPDECADIATAAVVKEYRGRAFDFAPSLLLYRALYTDTLRNPQFKQAVSIIKDRVYEQLLSLGMPFKPIFDSEAFYYLQPETQEKREKSYAVTAATSEFLPSLTSKARAYRRSLSPIQHLRANMMQKLIDGRGLDHMMGS